MMTTSVIIVGPGRLGRSVATLLERRQIPAQLIGRHDRIPRAALTYLTVPDREIGDAAARVPKGGVVLHASGATGVEVLRPHKKAGSLHPLMTFPGPEIALPSGEIPAAIAGDPEAVAAGRKLAELLGFVPFEVQGDRALYHAAAVTAGNFATALLHEASTMLAAAGVPMADAPACWPPWPSTPSKTPPASEHPPRSRARWLGGTKFRSNGIATRSQRSPTTPALCTTPF
jgi:predicted short-subunit dehydrogenase-like oxidoreductase (DUF2520 family)